MKVLVAYATKRGATAEIAEAVADELRSCGHDVDCVRAGDAADASGYDAVILGSAMYMRRWRPEARRFLSRQRRHLSSRPFWIFSSGPVGPDPDPAWSEPPRIVARAEQLGARGHVVFGGRMPLEPQGFVERAMVEKTPPEERDARDWDAIRDWARTVAAELAGSASRAVAGGIR
jgi:menaquinone-dependent protoporphyrinogen oxidase